MEENIHFLQISIGSFVAASFLMWGSSANAIFARVSMIVFGGASVIFGILGAYSLFNSSNNSYAIFLLLSTAFANLGLAVSKFKTSH